MEPHTATTSTLPLPVLPRRDMEPLRVVSLGAGVQSTAMLLMGLRGAFGPPPDIAIFADTGWEPPEVYTHLDWLERILAPFPIVRIVAGNLRQDLLDAVNGRARRVSNPPFFTRSARGKDGMLRRACTRDYKVAPLDRETLALLKAHRRPIAEKWIGISIDEAHRMKPSRRPRFVHRHPLVEHSIARDPGNRFALDDCISWLARHGYPIPPKSACVGCPYHSDAYWRHLKRASPQAWNDAITVDRAIRRSLPGVRGAAFLHRSRIPLEQVDLSTLTERGQQSLFGNECEGVCAL